MNLRLVSAVTILLPWLAVCSQVPLGGILTGFSSGPYPTRAIVCVGDYGIFFFLLSCNISFVSLPNTLLFVNLPQRCTRSSGARWSKATECEVGLFSVYVCVRYMSVRAYIHVLISLQYLLSRLPEVLRVGLGLGYPHGHRLVIDYTRSSNTFMKIFFCAFHGQDTVKA